jgi:AsmA protein
LKQRIAGSIAMALQRQVEIGNVHIRLLPQPGFDLENFVVHDDPAFSAEPVLRAQEVTAFLRLSSLLRGHLEISRLSLTEPSLNLTRNGEGRWNIENLLERTAKTAVAPTSKARSESRPAFPYIEADRGRINFKSGPEKKPFALADADYAFWQDSENAWGMRLRARPIRSDLNLSDTGQFRVNGTWQRAETLRGTPLEFNLSWQDAQLGQLTKLLSGQDKGWRGGVRVSAALTGTPADLAVDGDASLEDFRRYDIAGEALSPVRTHCAAHYSTVDRGFHQILCQTPMGDGFITVRGEVVNLPGPRNYDLGLAL